MPIVLETGSWVFWAVVIVVIICVMWAIWGGRRDMEVVGLRPLTTPTAFEHPMDYPVSVSPRYPDVVASSPHFFDDEGAELPTISPRYSPIHAVQCTRPPVDSTPVPLPVLSPVPGRTFRSIGEELTCTALEELLGRRVLNGIHPEHLRNPKTKRKLEYDCFDPSYANVGLAVEYDGAQHSKPNTRFHANQNDFDAQLARDALKIKLSVTQRIPLIKIPYTVDVCDPDLYDPSGFCYNRRITREQRYQRIYAFLRERLTYIARVGIDAYLVEQSKLVDQNIIDKYLGISKIGNVMLQD